MAEAKLAQQHILLPTGTTAQRPTGSFGMIRANTTTGYIEYYSTETSDWIGIGSFAASGGTETTSGNYNLHTYTSSGTFQVVSGAKSVEILQVAGGGGGGSWVGGGAGAGGVVYNSSTPLNIGTYTVTVGAGGAGSYNPGNYGGMPNGSLGGNTSFTGLTTAVGGGMGMSHDYDRSNGRANGGSGGGSSFSSSYGLGTAGQGNNGGSGNDGGSWSTGGGGGAAQAGQPRIDNAQSGYGGSGNYYSQFTHKGSPAGYFGGGGGGGNHDGNWQPSGYGGNGGGANGARTTGQAPSAVANTGGGGGGNGFSGGDPSRGGNGGSGIVIVRYIP